jgi:Amt family ammonium transporter
MEDNIFQLQYALDTFYFLVCGALVMWMAAGFAMLEAGLVRAKNTTEILTKNVALFAIACIMYMVCGYAIMYGGDFFLSTITGDGVITREPKSRPPTHPRQTSTSRSCSSPRRCPSSPVPWPSA